MPAEDLNRLTNSMRAIGYDARFPIVKFGGQILDGRNRWKAAELAHVNPTFIDFAGSDEEAHQFVITANEERRHLTPQWLEQHRRERIDRIAEARKGGKSIRVIAEEEGVSVGTVQRDIQAATVSGGDTVEPAGGKVTGKDGRTRPAIMPKIIAPVEELFEQGTISPKLREEVEALDRNQQGVVLEAVRAGTNPRKAINDALKPSREPGEDETAKGPKSGKLTFDNRTIKDAIGKLARLFNDRAQKLGLQKSPGWTTVRSKMDDLLNAWESWLKEAK